MTQHTQIVVIGGGVMGVSLVYHLAHLGVSDVVLLEKNELTAGSTWHAAGLCTHFAHSPTIMAMRARSVRLYRDELPRETGLATGFHACGALRVTVESERMREFEHVAGIGRFMGYDFHILSPSELVDLYPLVDPKGLRGAIYEPDDGYVDPSLATQAMAQVARERGVAIYRHQPVLGITRSSRGTWQVRTTSTQFEAEHVVNAAGTWCREIGAMMGMDLPVVPMLHQYLVTDSVAEIAQRARDGEPELPMIRDPEESWYLRQERDGFICGPYERDGQPWSIDGVPPEFGMELLPPDLDRVEHIVAASMARVPALSRAGIKTIVNGPITFTPDANPLVGPAFDVPNAWLLTGSSMGVMEGGGAGEFLAQWIVRGTPPMDPLAIDSRRFGAFADRAYRIDKAVESFGLQFGIHYPYEERAAGRPRRCTPLFESQAARGAVFGAAYGWERPNWYADNGCSDVPLSFSRPGWLDAVRCECLNVRDRVGVVDLSSLAKFEISGADASTFMATLGANAPPTRDGRITLVHALTHDAGVAAEFTVTRLASDRYYLTSAAAAERQDHDLLRAHAADFADVAIDNCTHAFGVLGVMGPYALNILGDVCDIDVSSEGLRFLDARVLRVCDIEARVLRLSYVGESGFELHVAMADLKALYDALMAAGDRYGIKPFGIYAMNAMRLEKGYPAWGLDLGTERTPLEAGLAHLVRTEHRTSAGGASRGSSAGDWCRAGSQLLSSQGSAPGARSAWRAAGAAGGDSGAAARVGRAASSTDAGVASTVLVASTVTPATATPASASLVKIPEEVMLASVMVVLVLVPSPVTGADPGAGAPANNATPPSHCWRPSKRSSSIRRILRKPS